MTVTKRTRYEVLRRDDYTCRYCRADDQPLTVDHVVPTALGGSDDPSNLVAACRDCNSGKASTSPDEHTVAQVTEEALQLAKTTAAAYQVLVQTIGDREGYVDEFADVFAGQSVPIGWRGSVGRWYDMAVPIELILDSAQRALDKPQRFSGYGRFTYFCGIVWNQVKVVGEHVALRSSLDGAYLTEDAQDEMRLAAYDQGWEAGYRQGQDDTAEAAIRRFVLPSQVDPSKMVKEVV